MNWGCPNARPLRLVPEIADYYGHTLEYVRGVAWSGWRCQWCGESFKTAEEHDHAGLPPMEVIETDELPTEAVEMAAWMLAVVASGDGRGFGHALEILLGNGDRWPEWRIPTVRLAFAAFSVADRDPFYRDDFSQGFLADINAEAEALIRTGEVTL